MASKRAIRSQVIGLERARRSLERVVRREKAGALAALPLIGEQAVAEIRRRAPLLTGRLRRSYTYDVGRDGQSGYVDVSTNVVYAPPQEFGWSGGSGTPHVRPGVDAVTRKVPALVAEAAARKA